MDVPLNKSILHINQHFNKILKTLVEKKDNNESIATELEWINNQLVSENRKIVKFAVQTIRNPKIDAGIALNALLSAYSRLKNDNYDIIADGIFDVLLETIHKSSDSVNFGIINKPHPALLFINEARMLYLSNKIEDLLANSKLTKFLQPIIFMILCNNETIYAESRSIWMNIVDRGNYQFMQDIISLRRTASPVACKLYNSMLITKFKKSLDIDIFLLILSSTKLLIEYSLDPIMNFKIFMENQELIVKNPHCANLVLFLLAEILQTSSVSFVSSIVNLLQHLIMKMKIGHSIVIYMILDGLIQFLGYPSILRKELKKVEELVNYIGCEDLNQHVSGSTKAFESPCVTFDENLCNAYDACKLIENNHSNFDSITKPNIKGYWTRNHLVLRGYLHSKELKNRNFDKWNKILSALIDISKTNETLKSSLIMPLLFELSQSFDPEVKISLLKNFTELGSSTEIFSTIKALSAGMMRSMAITLHFKMWKSEPRIYPFLHKYLVEKSPNDIQDFNLNIVRAAIIKEICDLKPHHGSDLVSIISEILNQSLESKTDESAAASLAIDSITILCQNHIISITSTWKAISLTTRYEKRPRVIKSLCNFFATVPQFRRNNLEFEMFNKDIVSRIFYMIQWGDVCSIQCALNAFKSWSYDTLTLDMIPDIFRENIALPEAPSGMEVSILDLEVPGECYVQLLSKVNPYALKAAGELISHFMRQEISEYRSGHYVVKEGQAEPVNYKNLPKQSIVKAITHFVIQQATTKKTEKLVDDTILVEALNILSQKYPRPLPPLNWSFLHELIHRDVKVRAKCMAIGAKQAVISGTAKRLIENFLINIDENSHEDIEIALDILVDLCNGTSNEILKLFFERLTTCRIEIFEEKIAKLLSHESDVTNRENLAMIISMFINRGNSSSQLSCNIIRAIPSNILNVIHLTSANKIKYRCEILKNNAHVENAVAWLNELFLDALVKNENRDFLSTTFAELIIEAEKFPTKKWLNEFIIVIQNKTIEKDTTAVDGLKFLLDIFIVGIVCMSGYFVVTSTNNSTVEENYRLFGQSLQLYSSQSINDDIVGNVFEFILYSLSQPSVPNEIKTTFKHALMMCKNHFYFKKNKPWQHLIDSIVS